MSKRKTLLITIGAIVAAAIVVFVIVNSLGGDDQQSTAQRSPVPSTATPSPTASATEQPTTAPTTPAPTAAPTPSDPPATKPATTPAKPKPTVVGIGDEVEDGDFVFKVTKVEPGPKVIGSGEFGAKPQGKFVFVRLIVENTGTDISLFSDEVQVGYDATGKTFKPDSEAAVYLENEGAFHSDVNPGNKINGILVFDVPKGATLAKVVLHQTDATKGVTVNLG